MAVIVLNNAPEIAFSRNPIAVGLMTDTNLATVNLKLILKLWVETEYKSGTFTNVHTQELPPDSLGKATFYIGSILNSFFTESVFPDFNTGISKEAVNNSKRYYFEYAEKSGSPIVIGSFSQSTLKFVINGGLSYETFTSLGFFTNYISIKKNFLTWALKPKKVTTTQQEYLYYLVFIDPTIGRPVDAPHSFRQHTKAYFSDGTTSEVYKSFIHNRLEHWDIYIFPTGYTQLDVANINPTKTVLKYDTWLTWSGDGTVISEVRTYIIEKKYYASPRTFLFSNSLGGVDTLVTTGNSKTKADISKIIANHFTQFDYLVKNGTRKTISEQETRSVICATGYKTKREVDRLRDMLLSQTVCECLTDMFVPIIINKYSSQIYQDNDDLFYLVFEYEHAFDNVNYTPGFDEMGIIPGEFNNDFNIDYTITH